MHMEFSDAVRLNVCKSSLTNRLNWNIYVC